MMPTGGASKCSFNKAQQLKNRGDVVLDLVQPPDHHLAQLNVARALDDLDSPRLADFVSALDRVNAVAERSPGFIWRLKDAGGSKAIDIKVTDDTRFIVNMSVWETPAHLEHFVWNTIHKRVYAKKSMWFEAMPTPHIVMWWVGRDHRPTAEEGMARLSHLTAHGPTSHAFGWESLHNIKLWMHQRCA
jgi:hypothetical protein